MFLHDLPDDGKPQPGAASAAGHIRLEQALSLAVGKSRPIVLDLDQHRPV
jgi:hypothetical protein